MATSVKEQLYQEIVYRLNHPEWYSVLGGYVHMPFNSTYNSPNLQELVNEGRIEFKRISDALWAKPVSKFDFDPERYELIVSWWAS